MFRAWQLYTRGDKVYLPTSAKTAAGFFLDDDPVEVVDLADKAGLRDAICRVVSKGNPEVPTPLDPDVHEPAVLKHAGLRTWSAFARRAELWTIKERDGNFEIIRMLKRPGGGWTGNPEESEALVPGTTVDQLAELLVVRLASCVSQSVTGDNCVI